MNIYQCVRSGSQKKGQYRFFITQNDARFGSFLCPARERVDLNYPVCTNEDNVLFYDKLIYKE